MDVFHTQKIYRCEKCPSWFNREADLESHKKKEHKITKMKVKKSLQFVNTDGYSSSEEFKP